MKKGKGRPPKPETIELRRIETLLNNVPPHIKKLAPNSHDLGMLESIEYDRQQILSDYQGYPTLPRSHIFKMAFIGEEAIFGREAELLQTNAELLQKHEELVDKAKGYRKKGAAAYRKLANERAEDLCNKNSDLLARMQPLGPLSLADVVRKIQKFWFEFQPVSRLINEMHLDRRGIVSVAGVEEVPSAKTIGRYIRKASPFKEHRT